MPPMRVQRFPDGRRKAVRYGKDGQYSGGDTSLQDLQALWKKRMDQGDDRKGLTEVVLSSKF